MNSKVNFLSINFVVLTVLFFLHVQSGLAGNSKLYECILMSGTSALLMFKETDPILVRSLKKAENALFLADGSKEAKGYAESIAGSFPKIHFVKTDLWLTGNNAYPGQTAVPSEFKMPPESSGSLENLAYARVNNVGLLPFKAGTFDTIVMNRALCPCCRGKTCAGFKMGVNEATSFLMETARLLNSSNSDAYAILEGASHNYESAVREVWKPALEQVEKKYPLLLCNIEFFRDHKGKMYFRGISFKVKPKSALH